MSFRDQFYKDYKEANTDVKLLAANLVDYFTTPTTLSDPNQPPLYPTALPNFAGPELKSIAANFRNNYNHNLEALVEKFKPENQTSNPEVNGSLANENLRKYGTIYLGAYFLEFSKRNSIVTEITTINETVKYPNTTMLQSKIHSETINAVSSNLEELLNGFRADINTDNLAVSPSELTTSEYITSIPSRTEKILDDKSGFEAVNESYSIFYYFFDELYESPDPIQGIVNLGHNFIVAVELAYLALDNTELITVVAQKTAETIKEGAEVVGGPFSLAAWIPAKATRMIATEILKLIELLKLFLIPALFFGVLLAFWLPFIPLIHWIGGIVGFFILFMQALILTPLLALSHLLSGETGFFNSKNNHGYMTILQLVTYLPLMVFSFFIAYFILAIGSKVIQIVFLPYVDTMSFGNISGIVTFFVFMALFFIINMSLFNRCFSLITTIPEKAGKFIGGGEEMLGDNGHQDMKGGFVAFSSKLENTGEKASNLFQNINSEQRKTDGLDKSGANERKFNA